MTASDDSSTHLPAVIDPVRAGTLTPLPGGNLIPPLIADAGDQAAWRYIDFFTANIRRDRLKPGGWYGVLRSLRTGRT